MKKAVILVLAAAAVGLMLQPSALVRDAVLGHYGFPAYKGMWILIPHVFLYSTLSALYCAIAWTALAAAGWIAPAQFRLSAGVITKGVIAGLISVAFTVAVFFAMGMQGAFHAPHVDPWLMAANLFSNFYEELIFRGFILAALTALFGFWPAALLSSLAFGLVHSQYPLPLQLLVAAMGFLWCWISRNTGSLFAPWIAHMTLDWIIDPIV
ncbi:MAG: CPBP family intramembrane glutamic endopeptidase [Parvularculaceae bacterium]